MSVDSRKNRTQRQVASFIIIGVLVNVIYVSIFLIVTTVFPEKRLFASVISYAGACLFQYVANARSTFERPALSGKQFGRYLLCVLGGLGFSAWCLTTIPKWIPIPDVVLIVLVAGLIAVANFILFRQWVYSEGRL